MITDLYSETQRIALNILVNPTAIYFGYHFLKSFFYYNSKDSKETDQAVKSLGVFNELMILLLKIKFLLS